MLFIINWGYNIVLESRGGQTLGKKHMQLRVVQDNGLPSYLSQLFNLMIFFICDALAII